MEDEEKLFAADRAKTGRSGCKRCKGKIEQGALRLARLVVSPFGESGGKMKSWHHVACLFEALSKARATTRKIEDPEQDIDGWDQLTAEDQQEINTHLEDLKKAPAKKVPAKKGAAAKKVVATSPSNTPAPSPSKTPVSPKKPDKVQSKKPAMQSSAVASTSSATTGNGSVDLRHHKDNSFRAFRALLARLSDTPAYLEKSALVREMFTSGTGGDGFHGDLKMWVRMLLPGVQKRIYNLRTKQIVKLFCKILGADMPDMQEDIEQGDVASTVKLFFEQSQHCPPHIRSTLTMQEVDEFLEGLSKVRSEEEQEHHFKTIIKRCTANDLQTLIRLIVHDLRINAKAKPILDGLHPDAYEVFKNSQDLDAVVEQVMNQKDDKTALSSKVALMTPIQPMLAEACKSVEQAMTRCPNGMYSEVKYDGERVQLHKKGSEFKYFSRSLKPVVPHKVQHLAEHIPLAFPHGRDLILDAEVLLMDTTTGKPLPFGTLGKHKKEAFKDASVCLFVFDCLYYNGKTLLHKTIQERRKILKANMQEVENHVVLSETQEIYDQRKLEAMIARVLSEGLEGLVLKDLKSEYEPGKRHWLKVKKDYLCGGKMADTADLVPLGAWFGTGCKGGMMSIFLMCCWDPHRKCWLTVTKVHGGFDDKALEKLQTELEMEKISKEETLVPSWLKVPRTLVPDFVAKDPTRMPVWEITGAEFTSNDKHSAGISVRFPRVTRPRPDKTFKEATNLHELRTLYENSRHGTDVGSLFGITADNDDEPGPSTSTDNKPTSPSKAATPQKKNSSKKRTSDEGDDEASPAKRATPATPSKRPPAPGPLTSPLKPPAGLKKPLPDVFLGVKMVLPSWASSRREELTRYFIAFGGELLSATRAHHATHCLYNADHPSARRAGATPRPVTVHWLWDSIRAKSLQPVTRYSP